jgi:cation diffusion facilitator CzcD-associated flavoprotein CzcO
METVSLSNWMDLPGYSLADWLGGQPLLARLPAGIIREYMHAYVKHLELSDNFKEFTTVTNITKLCCDFTQMVYWRVQGHYANGEHFEFTCKRVVLACGRKRHRTLEVSGELQAPNLVYNVRAMKQLLCEQEELDKAHLEQQLYGENRPVIVVGDGISAADAITHCLNQGIEVLHVFRRTEKQLKSEFLRGGFMVCIFET